MSPFPIKNPLDLPDYAAREQALDRLCQTKDWPKISRVLGAYIELPRENHTLVCRALIDEYLSKVMRFRDDHCMKNSGDNTAHHTKQVVLLVDDIFKEAKKNGLPDSLEMQTLRRDCLIAADSHDDGEVLGEPRTFAGKCNSPSPLEPQKEEMEHRLARFAWKLADYAVRKKDVEIFRTTMRHLKAEANIEEKGLEGLADILPQISMCEHTIDSESAEHFRGDDTHGHAGGTRSLVGAWRDPLPEYSLPPEIKHLLELGRKSTIKKRQASCATSSKWRIIYATMNTNCAMPGKMMMSPSPLPIAVKFCTA